MIYYCRYYFYKIYELCILLLLLFYLFYSCIIFNTNIYTELLIEKICQEEIYVGEDFSYWWLSPSQFQTHGHSTDGYLPELILYLLL